MKTVIAAVLALVLPHPVDPSLRAMPENLEVRYALSALPPQLREQAAVYVLDPAKGYRLYRAGTNGQHCFVERTEWEYADYDNLVAYAICYDDGAAGSQLKLAFDVATLRAQGLSAEALKAEIQKRMKAGTYPPPARAGFSYMVEPVMRAHLSMNVAIKTVATAPMPHLMYYAPNVTDADVGTVPPFSPYPLIRQPGPMGVFVQMLGQSEGKEILGREQALVKDLCAYSAELCLTIPGSR